MAARTVGFNVWDNGIGSYRGVKNQGMWIYSNGALVTQNGVTLSAGWHLVTRPWVAFTHMDWDPKNGAPPRDPPPPNITEWVHAYDGIVPGIAPTSVTCAPLDFTATNANPVEASAGWTYSGTIDPEWLVVADFYADDVLVSSKTIPYDPTVKSVKSGPVYYKGQSMYCRVRYHSLAGDGPSGQSSTTIYPGRRT